MIEHITVDKTEAIIHIAGECNVCGSPAEMTMRRADFAAAVDHRPIVLGSVCVCVRCASQQGCCCPRCRGEE